MTLAVTDTKTLVKFLEDSRMLHKATNARTGKDVQKSFLFATATYYFEADGLRSNMTWDEKSYAAMLKTQEHMPAMVGKIGSKVWWLFKREFYWEESGYAAEQVQALLLGEQKQTDATQKTSSQPQSANQEKEEHFLTEVEKNKLVRYIGSTIEELACALEMIQLALDGKDKNPDEDYDPRDALFIACNGLAREFAVSDGRVSDVEAQFMIDLIKSLIGASGRGEVIVGDDTIKNIKLGYAYTAPAFQRDLRESYIQATIGVLKILDSAKGTTSYAEKARTVFFQIANAVAKADGRITEKEKARLAEFKNFLWQSDSEAESSPDMVEQTNLKKQKGNEQIKPVSQEDLLNELNSLVGLERVKRDVLALVNFLKVQQLRKAQGLPTPPITLHLIFYGNPGTGKTTVARLVAQIYRSLGILSKGHLTETDRAGLVAGYVGQTALKVTEMVNNSLGGILFIDEAYTLSAGGGNDYGQEAVDTLLKQMEDHRDDLIVVVAGYTSRMEQFISSNPGLRSRFTKFLQFDDYNAIQLTAIFESFCGKAGYNLSEQARVKVGEIFQKAYANRDETFGNARFARNLFESAISHQADRIVSLDDTRLEALSMIEEDDFPNDGFDKILGR
jgi:SpoVK/Ycf46/Vps4 family AAA+-type ATPase